MCNLAGFPFCCSQLCGPLLGEMEKHLKLLAELVPDWLTIHPVRKDFYLKLCKSMDLNIVQDKLALRLKEEQRL